MLKTAGEHAETINSKNNGNFSNVFVTLQTALDTEAVMAIARLFDNPSKKCPTRCIKGLLNYLNDNSNELPEIREPYQLKLLLKSKNVPDNSILAVDENPIIFPQLFTEYIFEILDTPENVDTSNKLRFLRAKTLTHNEKRDADFAPSWNALQELIELAQFVVGVLGWAYLSTVFILGNDYLLTNDALRPSIGFKR